FYSFKGREYDATGKMSKWWTTRDIATFTSKAQCFVRQYSVIFYVSVQLSGTRNLVENIADNGAISAILLVF
ncbi:endothelin-converting enzyme, putative, partial [Ixodes scapularis]